MQGSDAVKIEEVLKDVPDRSVWIDYEGFMIATTRIDYFNECGYWFPCFLALFLSHCRSSGRVLVIVTVTALCVTV